MKLVVSLVIVYLIHTSTGIVRKEDFRSYGADSQSNDGMVLKLNKGIDFLLTVVRLVIFKCSDFCVFQSPTAAVTSPCSGGSLEGTCSISVTTPFSLHAGGHRGQALGAT